MLPGVQPLFRRQCQWSRLLAAALLLVFGGWLSGCSPDIGPAAPSPKPPPKPRNADQIARAIVGGQIDVLAFVDRLSDHPLAPRIVALEQLQPLLYGTGLDPLRDLERAYVTAPHVRREDSVIVVGEHRVSAQQVQIALQTLIARSDPPGRWLTDQLGIPAVRVTIERRTRVVALPEPNVVVVLTDRYAAAASRFVGTGGLPLPLGPEAMVATAVDPAQTLKAPRVPAVPPTVRTLRMTVTRAPAGALDLYIEGQSTTPEQAQLDAAAMTESIDRATSVKIVIFKVRLIRPIHFVAQGDRVVGKRRLSQAELEKILGFVSSLLPKPRWQPQPPPAEPPPTDAPGQASEPLSL